MKTKIFRNTDLITIDKDQGLTEAMALMDKKSISHLLVRDEGKIIGIITTKDITKKLANARDLGNERKLRATQFHVSSAMNKNLKTIQKDADLKDAAKMMIANKISSLAVVENDENEVIGLVTKTDIIKGLKDSKDDIELFYNPDVITIPSGSQ
ncbi:MAG: hypothetical protein CVT90_00150 [Candidatus Altiarchaeales archaeon HGW-Altiarchaeales-3]|nr:MAG: hypothetical protein CVT90_00150 [Candidatus Altiarchaeales archaeon HGW-Altiarchaeales-3]